MPNPHPIHRCVFLDKIAQDANSAIWHRHHFEAHPSINRASIALGAPTQPNSHSSTQANMQYAWRPLYRSDTVPSDEVLHYMENAHLPPLQPLQPRARNGHRCSQCGWRHRRSLPNTANVIGCPRNSLDTILDPTCCFCAMATHSRHHWPGSRHTEQTRCAMKGIDRQVHLPGIHLGRLENPKGSFPDDNTTPTVSEFDQLIISICFAYHGITVPRAIFSLKYSICYIKEVYHVV